MTYALRLSDDELMRYRSMAADARELERDQWRLAGIGPGARVVDVGCGPGGMLAVLAETVRPGGSVIGVDAAPEAVAAARVGLTALGVPEAEVMLGRAEATGLAPGSFDVAVLRHVLAHNGGREQAVVDHLATLVRPGGAVLMADIHEGGALGLVDEPDLDDLVERYVEWHAARGNDLTVGRRLAALGEAASLETVRHDRVVNEIVVRPGMRGPAWAARGALVEAGLADAADVARWEAAFAEVDARTERPVMTVSYWIAVCRKP